VREVAGIPGRPFGGSAHQIRAALVWTALLAAGRPASAQEPERADVNWARDLFQRGVEQFEAGELDAALRSFRDSFAIVPHPETTYNIAGVLSRQGRYHEAIAEYERYIETSPHIREAKRRDVETEIARLRASLGSLVVVVEPAGADVAVDGVQVGTAPLQAPIELDPGTHAVEARLGGHEVARANVEVAPGGTAQAELRLEPLPAVLTIVNMAPGAAVEVDGTLVPSAEVEAGVRVPAGRHVVRATAEGYEPAEREIVVGPGANVHVELPLARMLPAPRLRIVGSDGALLFVDGLRVGALPWDGPVEPGERLLVVEGDGVHRWEGTVSARRGETLDVQVELGRLPSGPDPAWIWAMAGIAVAGGAGALGFGVAAMDANDKFDSTSAAIQNGSYESADELLALQSQGRSAAAEARDWALGCDVSWGMAAAGAAASLLLLLLYDSGEEGPTVTFSSAVETGLGAVWSW
jgi:hypothetical protein